MRLLAGQTDEISLSLLGREVVSLLERRDFRLLADRFDYALAFGKPPAIAIEEEMQSCITKFQDLSDRQNPVISSIAVKYFDQNGSGLVAVVECVFTTCGCPILAELIVITSATGDNYATLEEVSLIAD